MKVLASVLVLTVLRGVASADSEKDLAGQLRSLDATVLPKDPDRSRLLGRDVRARLQAANDRESTAWRKLTDRAEWEKYRDARVSALRASLGTFPLPKDLKVRVTSTLKGEGYRIENLVYESRPGLLVTANLYVPARPVKAAPGILIVHSHHNPKSEGELQDMGMLWARAGCFVLVMDQLGHGERRQHPFLKAADYPAPFRVGRQDYYFRHIVGLQLQLAGESLMGWMAHDLMRGVDLLLARPGIDKTKIILLGSVAGGGDPAAVTGALDPRIAAVVPFNFGGPQPETVYPLPADAEKSFNYAGSGSWEATRNLARSAKDGFLPWVIVGSIAPRRLVYGHEFAWDQARDPVWARLEKVFGWYDVPNHLAFATGKGRLSGRPPESSHCNNIGAFHRIGIHADFKRWYAIEPPLKETRTRIAPEELMCLTKDLRPRLVHELASKEATERARANRKRRAPPHRKAGRDQLRSAWAEALGQVEAGRKADVIAYPPQKLGDARVERLSLEVEKGVPVPLLLLVPPHKPGRRLPVVVAVAQGGKQAFLKERADHLARLLRGGVVVALPDLRGTGETRPGDGRGRGSAATSLAASELMLGRTMLGARLVDLRGVLAYLRSRKDLVDGERVALWGDSFAPVNEDGKYLYAPLDAPKPPHLAEPLGGLLALFGALYDDKVKVVYARGGLVSYQALLDSPFCHVPYDVVVPGALTVGDLGDVTAALAPRPVRLAGFVDGLNRQASAKDVQRALQEARASYKTVGADARLSVTPPAVGPAKWLLDNLKAK